MHLCVRSPEGASPLPEVSVLPVIGAESSLLTRLETDRGRLVSRDLWFTGGETEAQKGTCPTPPSKGDCTVFVPLQRGFAEVSGAPHTPSPPLPQNPGAF